MRTPPGKCFIAAIAIGALITLGFVCGSASRAEPKKKPAPESDNSREKRAVGGTGTSPEKKEKTYTFGGLDIDGKLKTPQLLYFLNRMKSEFDTTTPDKRSFIPELKRSTDEM